MTGLEVAVLLPCLASVKILSSAPTNKKLLEHFERCPPLSQFSLVLCVRECVMLCSTFVGSVRLSSHCWIEFLASGDRKSGFVVFQLKSIMKRKVEGED